MSTSWPFAIPVEVVIRGLQSERNRSYRNGRNPMSSSFSPLPLFIVLVYVAIIWLGAYIAHQKGRSRTEGALLALFLSLFGVLIEALLPTKAGNPTQR
jgi:hypothetical protein